MNRFTMFVGASALALLTACGGGSDSDGGKDSSSSVPSSQASSASSIQSSVASSQSSVQSSIASSVSSSASSVLSSAGGSTSSVPASSATFTKAKKDLAAFGAFDFQGALGSAAAIASGSAPKLRTDISAYVCPNGGTADASANGMTYKNCVNGTMKTNGSVTYSNVTASETSVSGTYKFNNYMVEIEDESTLMNLTIKLSANLSSYQVISYDATIDGSAEVERPGHSDKVTLNNYKVHVANNAYTISGSVTVNSNPDTCGANGTYTYKTISPLTYGSDFRINGGTLQVGSTSYVFNSNGTVTVNGETYTLAELENSCSL